LHRLCVLDEVRQETGILVVTEIVSPATITLRWRTAWRRWDGLPYTALYPGGFAETDTDLVYADLEARAGQAEAQRNAARQAAFVANQAYQSAMKAILDAKGPRNADGQWNFSFQCLVIDPWPSNTTCAT
jgi:hypothetical protein